MRYSIGSEETFGAQHRSTREILSRVSAYLRPYKWLAVGTVVCALLSVGAGFAFPALTGYIIDHVIKEGADAKLVPAMIALLLAFLLRDGFNACRILINNTFEQNVIYDMRCQVYARLQRLPIHYFDRRASGDLMTRVIEDVNSVERVLIDGTEQGTVALLSVIGVPVILFFYNPLLASVALIPLPLLMGGALWYTLTARSRYRQQRRAASAMNALLMDNLQGHRQIKAFSRERYEDKRFGSKADELRRATLRVMRAWATYNPSMSFATALGTVLVMGVGGSQVLAGSLSVGELVMFLLFLDLFYQPVGKLHTLNQLAQSARAAGERVFDILDTPLERADRQELEPLAQPVQGEVVYDRVSFQYTPDRVALKEVSLHARPGEMIALVGPTGAGKSTLVSLLPGFYELTSGTITIDGQDIQETSLSSLRENIAVVSQEPFLFNGSVRENILYGKLDATDEELVAAAKASNCHDFIMRLPEGYETGVGERGVQLSAGEKQRVSIARALLKDAPILILDEATASVDTATEQLIQEALEHLMQGRTSFVIAHRLSTIYGADQILVMLHGEVVERGTHEELLAEDGLYARLARSQSTTLIEEGFERLSVSEP